jgi:myosin heavy subunit
LNETAKKIKETDAALETVTTSLNEYKEAFDNQPNYCNLLYSFLNELKQIAITETTLSGNYSFKTDPAFVQFIADQAAIIDPTIQEKYLKEARFIKSDFFTADSTKRLQQIQTFVKQNEFGYAILASQFISNILLKNQVEIIMGTISKLQEISQMDIIQQGDTSDLVGIFKRTQEELTKLKNNRKQLHATLKKSQENQISLAKSEAGLKTKVGQLTGQLENITNEYDVMKVKFQVASNELLLRKDPVIELASQIRSDVEDQQHLAKQRTAKLEEALTQKSKECSELSSLLKKLQKTLEDSLKKQQRRFSRQEEALKGQVIEMQGQMDAMETQLTSKKKSAKRNERSLKEQYDSSIRDLSAHYEESKRSLMTTIDTLREKAKQGREMTKKLVESLSEAEQKNQKLQTECNEGRVSIKALSAEIGQLKQAHNKDLEHLHGQISAQTMAFDSKMMAANQEAKSHLSRVLDSINEAVGSFYNLDDGDFGEEDLKGVLKNLKEDLGKLQLFQLGAANLDNINLGP